MGLTVAFQMDPLETIDPAADTTFALALEAQRRGHTLYHYLPSALTLRGDRVRARARTVTFRRDGDPLFACGADTTLPLAEADVVMMRQDPPFDMGYITATHVLDTLHPRPLVVNDPTAVRNAPEKIFVTRFPELMPPTLITSDVDEIAAFREEHRDIVLKPLFGKGGEDIFRVQPGDQNLSALVEMFARFYREPIMVQRYLPEIREGDKRIILVDGEPAGAVNRIPAGTEARANFHAGGRAEAAALTERDRAICAAIGPELRERGLVLAGIDVIGGYLTEINVTSPTGVQEIDRLDDACVEARVWDAIEARMARP